MPTAPFNLNTFVFTPGDDEVIVDDTVDVDGGSPGQVLGIFNEFDVDTGKGADLIDGKISGTNDQSDVHLVAGIYNYAEIDTGHGRDTLNGEVDYMSVFGGGSETIYFGITSGGFGPLGHIKTGKNDDIINGTATVDGNAEAVGGIGNVYINSGVGIDKITGTANVTPASESSFSQAAGIFNSKIVAEKGDDDVTGTATVEGDDFTNVSSVFGIVGQIIDERADIDFEIQTFDEVPDEEEEPPREPPEYERFNAMIDAGRGNDLVEGTANVEAGSASIIAGIGSGRLLQDSRDGVPVPRVLDTEVPYENGDRWYDMDLLSIEMGKGNDDLIGTANVTITRDSFNFGINGITGVHADLGTGTDLVEGKANVIVASEATVESVNGIANSYIESDKSSDTVTGHAMVELGEFSSARGVNGICNTMIDTGRSRDVIEGTSTIIPDAESGDSGGSGIIYSDIDTGAGGDTVRGTALTAIGEGQSYGIAFSTIHLGKGDDEIVARGATEGVHMVEFFGEKGDDVFDLQSGTGTVDGGKNDDLLILEGNSGDFVYTNNGGGTGNISGGGTNLDVADIEEFQFDNGTFDFGDLF